MAAELKTTFASHYTRTVSLAEALTPEAIAVYAQAFDRRQGADQPEQGPAGVAGLRRLRSPTRQHVGRRDGDGHRVISSMTRFGGTVSKTFQVTFVCMGNICRSPTAHGVFRQKVSGAGLGDRIRVDSAGTHDYHPGAAPDPRSVMHAARRAYDLSDLRARQLVPMDFERADLVLVMDADNEALTEQTCPIEHRHKIRRLTAFCRIHSSPQIPDPYYGDASDFEHVLDLVEDACDGLLEFVRQRLR